MFDCCFANNTNLELLEYVIFNIIIFNHNEIECYKLTSNNKILFGIGNILAETEEYK